MKNRRLLLAPLLLPLVTLASCGKLSYGFPSEDLPTIDQNGDLLVHKGATGLTYNDVTLEGSIEAYNESIAANQDFFLLFTRPTCSHCIDLEPTYVEFALKSGLRIYRDELPSEGKEMREWATSFSGLASIKDNIATPVMHLIQANNGDPKATYLNFYASDSSAESLSAYMSKQLNRTNIYRFETYEGVAAFRESHQEALYFFASNEYEPFYYENVYEVAKKSEKPLAYINVASFDDADKEKLAGLFPASYIDQYVYVDGVSPDAHSFKNEAAEAKADIDSYYKD